MRIQISAQCLYFLAAVLLGAFLGLCYEPLRVLRAAFRHKNAVVAVQDFLFCLFAAACTIALCYAFGSGTVRWFALCGIGLGLFFYFCTLGRLISRCTARIIAAIRRFCAFVKARCLTPIYRMLKQMFALVRRRLQAFRAWLDTAGRARRHAQTQKRLLRGARRGFHHF